VLLITTYFFVSTCKFRVVIVFYRSQPREVFRFLGYGSVEVLLN